MDQASAKLLWVGRQSISSETLALYENIRPIRIAAGALGSGTPSRTLSVSPQHRLLASGPIVKRMFGDEQILVPAKALVGLPGIEIVTENDPIVYHHLCCVGHEVIFANGAAAETFFPGKQALISLAPTSRSALLEAAAKAKFFRWVSARQFATVRRGKKFAERCAKNDMRLVH